VHEGRAHVVGDLGRENTVEAEPDEAFDELMNGEESGEGGEEEFALVFDARERGDADAGESRAAYEVDGGGEAHVAYSNPGWT
jgi:hypothetical protein